MGKHVLLYRERGNHRILEARLTQRNDTGLGFYLKGTQEQNLTVKKATFRYILLTADETRHVSMRTVTRFTDLKKVVFVYKVYELCVETDGLSDGKHTRGRGVERNSSCNVSSTIPQSFACVSRLPSFSILIYKVTFLYYSSETSAVKMTLARYFSNMTI